MIFLPFIKTAWYDWKDKINLKFDEVIAYLTINCNRHIALYISKGNQTMKFGQLIEYKLKKNLLEKS